MTAPWDYKPRYRVQERSGALGTGSWYDTHRSENLEECFVLVRDQERLITEGRRCFPERMADYRRKYRVFDSTRNCAVVWPSLNYQLPPYVPLSKSDHMGDALSYVIQGHHIHSLRKAGSPSTI